MGRVRIAIVDTNFYRRRSCGGCGTSTNKEAVVVGILDEVAMGQFARLPTVVLCEHCLVADVPALLAQGDTHDVADGAIPTLADLVAARARKDAEIDFYDATSRHAVVQ